MGRLPHDRQRTYGKYRYIYFFEWMKQNNIENKLNETVFNEIIKKAGEIF